MNFSFLGFFSLAETGLDPFLLLEGLICWEWFLRSSPLSSLRPNFSFLDGTYLLAIGIYYLRAVLGRLSFFSYLLCSMIARDDFFRFVFVFIDSSVGLWLDNFLGSLLAVSWPVLYVSGLVVLMMVDLLLSPSPPLLLWGLSLFWDIFVRGSSSF